jgi:phosphoglycolate phosphatase-like HAD superfamily hydrolase
MFDSKSKLVSFLSQLKGILIDLDETLLVLGVDWEVLKKSFNDVYESTYHTPLPVKRFMEIFGYIKQNHGEAALQPYIDLQRQHETAAIISPKTVPLWLIKDGLTILGSIVPQSTIWAVISNNFHNTISKVLDRFSIKFRFQSIIGRDDVKEAKPDPEGLLRIIKLYGLPVKECLYIGNHETDEMAANAANIPYIDILVLQKLFS